MKKMMTTLTLLTALTLTAAPVLAAEKNNGNINIKGDKNNINIQNTTNNIDINFQDVQGHWAEKYIKDLVKKKVLNGVSKDKFDPENKVTREQWATMVAKYFNLTAADAEQDFADVMVDRWSYPFIDATQDYFDAFHDLQGNLLFHPEEGAKREDVTVTLVKVLAQLDPSVTVMDADLADQLLTKKFKDVHEIAPALRPYVATAVKNGLINGEDGRFAPNRVLSRAEAATLLDRLGDNSVVVQ